MLRRTLLAVVLALLAATPAASASELIEIDLPSKGNVDVTQVKFNGRDHPGVLKARVLLPDGYDPRRRWPVLYLLHGAGENYRSWTDKTKAAEAAAGLPAIIVMPDAATGFYTNWWNDGKRGSPGWERYFLDEVIPMVEARFPIRRGRRWHAVAGFSMGGYGTAFLASQRPDYFGAAGPMSGFLAPRRPEMPIAFDYATGQSYAAIYGPPDGAYVAGHDPVHLAGNLGQTRMFVITGNGVPNPALTEPDRLVDPSGSIGEADLRFHAEDFAAALERVGADVTLTVLPGVHTHPYWNDHLRRMIKWGPFRPVAEHPDTWSYRTVADRGRAWELTYRFAEPPEVVEELARTGRTYTGAGAGDVELCAPDGRGLRTTLPFDDQPLRRALKVRVVGRSAEALRVRVQAVEPADVRLRSPVARTTSFAIAAGETRTVALRLTRRARRTLDRTRTRVRVVARHGTCAGGRWTAASGMIGPA